MSKRDAQIEEYQRCVDEGIPTNTDAHDIDIVVRLAAHLHVVEAIIRKQASVSMELSDADIRRSVEFVKYCDSVKTLLVQISREVLAAASKTSKATFYSKADRIAAIIYFPAHKFSPRQLIRAGKGPIAQGKTTAAEVKSNCLTLVADGILESDTRTTAFKKIKIL